jgi:stalled ribosome rescue protein Dom34
MKTSAGLWIDHRKAVVVVLSDQGEEIKEVVSNVDKQRGRMDGKRLNEKFDSGMVAADDRQQRDFTGHLNIYYKEVFELIKDAEAILLMGPGEAKDEFRKLIEREHGDHRHKVVIEETADKMTDPQIAAKVRDFFGGRKINSVNS